MSEKSVEMHGYNSFESIQMSVLANSLTGTGRFNPTMSERLRIRLGMSKDWKKDLRPDVLRNIQVTKGLQEALRDATGKDGSKGDKAPQRNPGLNTVIDADETEAKK
jgi:hypothetical protein